MIFSRNDTTAICKKLKIPFWVDPTNADLQLKRNLIRHKIIVFKRRLFFIKIVQMKLIYQRKKKLENGGIKNYTKKLRKFAQTAKTQKIYMLLQDTQALTIPKRFF